MARHHGLDAPTEQYRDVSNAFWSLTHPDSLSKLGVAAAA
jgi:hypothetical protein